MATFDSAITAVTLIDEIRAGSPEAAHMLAGLIKEAQRDDVALIELISALGQLVLGMADLAPRMVARVLGCLGASEEQARTLVPVVDATPMDVIRMFARESAAYRAADTPPDAVA